MSVKWLNVHCAGCAIQQKRIYNKTIEKFHDKCPQMSTLQSTNLDRCCNSRQHSTRRHHRKLDVNCKSSGCLWTGQFREHEQYFKICEKIFNAVCKWRVQRGSGKGGDGSAHFPKCKAEGRCQGNVSKSMLLPSVSKRITCPLSCGTSLSR